MMGQAMRKLVVILMLMGAPGWADPVDDVAAMADRLFPEMPRVSRVREIAGQCGADETVHPVAAYCTSQNRIFVASDAADRPETPYLVAHLFGHAVQVRHGVADVALAAIRSRRDEEDMLRGLVERQVDCIAGFLLAQAGLSAPDLTTLFTEDPLSGPHWGRDPLRIGPEVTVPVTARQEWLANGLGGDLSRCAPGEFGSDLLVAALRG